jgi:ethanolamine ammonia-lyase large subunit
VGDFRNWLLADDTDSTVLAAVAPGVTPEMAAAVQDHAQPGPDPGGKKCRVQTAFAIPSACRAGSTRLQPNHPTDDASGIAASMLDGLMYGNGDAVIGINPATDNVAGGQAGRHDGRCDARYEIPTQSCVLTHVTNTIAAIERGAPVDLVFQSIAGTEAANRARHRPLLAGRGARPRCRPRGTVGDNVMYFETGRAVRSRPMPITASTSRPARRARMRWRGRFEPLLVNTVVGFIGPEYLYDGKQIIRAGLEDHFCAKLLGLPMGCDVCYTNHAEADQNDMDVLLTLLGVAGCTFVMGIPGSDDIMLNYQTTSFHDALYARRVLGSRPAPSSRWLHRCRSSMRWPRSRHSACMPTCHQDFARTLLRLQ